MTTKDRQTKRALFDKLVAEHAASCPPSKTQKTRAFEAAYGDFNAAATAAVARPSASDRRLSVIPVGLAILVLLIVVLLAGCANPIDPALRRSVEAIERNWPVVRDASRPAEGVDPLAHQRATAAMDYAVREAAEAARAE